MPRLPVPGGDLDQWGQLLVDWLLASHRADGSEYNRVTFNNQTGTAYTLVLADDGVVVGMNNASPNVLTVPTNTSVPFLVGAVVPVRQVGVGTTTIVGAGAVVIHSRGGATGLAGQYAWATLIHVDTDVWELAGDVL